MGLTLSFFEENQQHFGELMKAMALEHFASLHGGIILIFIFTYQYYLKNE